MEWTNSKSYYSHRIQEHLNDLLRPTAPTQPLPSDQPGPATESADPRTNEGSIEFKFVCNTCSKGFHHLDVLHHHQQTHNPELRPDGPTDSPGDSGDDDDGGEFDDEMLPNPHSIY